MLEQKAILKQLEGKSDEEKIQMLQDEIGVNLQLQPPYSTSKVWYAQVFTYCHTSELQCELNNFLFIMNLLASIFGFCFYPEDTICLDCDNPCGCKEVILYYSITFTDLELSTPVL